MIEQHAEDAAFLCQLRNHAVAYPHYTLADLRELDERLDANLDGLLAAGNQGWRACAEQFEMFPEAPEFFPLVVLAVESRDAERIAFVVEALAAQPELVPGMTAALAWLDWERTAPLLAVLSARTEPPARCAWIAAHAEHGRDPGAALFATLHHEDLILRARALRAVGELGRKDCIAELRIEYTNPDETCRYSAAWSGALVGDAAATKVLVACAESAGAFAEPATAMAARRLPAAEATSWLHRLGARPENTRAALTGAAASGDPATMQWILGRMPHLEHARLAGEAFCWITGVDLQRDELESVLPDGFASGPNDDEEDENVAMDPDEHLAWPHARRIEQWWRSRHQKFPDGKRHLAGRPITEESLAEVLRSGGQRQRAAAAIELAIRSPGKPLFNVRAPAFRQ